MRLKSDSYEWRKEKNICLCRLDRTWISRFYGHLGYTDGFGAEEGVSYLEMVEFIIQNGAKIKDDLIELFRRITFSIAVSNTDDHLRNHGFILTKQGWILSPAYDINPNPYGTSLKLNISEDDNSLDFDLALSVAPYFRLTDKEATDIIEHIKSTVTKWPETATKYRVPKSEREMMSTAFRLCFNEK